MSNTSWPLDKLVTDRLAIRFASAVGNRSSVPGNTFSRRPACEPRAERPSPLSPRWSLFGDPIPVFADNFSPPLNFKPRQR